MGLRSIYIDTEHTFSSIRLLNMIGGFDSKQEHLLELVRTEKAFDTDSLMRILQLIETQLDEEHITETINQYPVLIVIDSIAAPLRMSAVAFSRDRILLAFTDCAKRLATRYNMLVLGRQNHFYHTELNPVLF
jgi:predicted transcriptional regulator